MLKLESITSHLVSEPTEEEPITSLVVDKESFEYIWDEITRLDLKGVQTNERPDAFLMRQIREQQRIPILVRTSKTAKLFDELGIYTTKFCGIVRGASKHPMVIKESA
jgi:hypothetical protein